MLPRAFALDMLECVLSNHAVVFNSLPNFERLLGGRLASLLMTSLRSERAVDDEARPLSPPSLSCLADLFSARFRRS